MPHIPLTFSLRGGWSTDSGTSATSLLTTQQGIVTVPWLTTADNILYTMDGWFRKMPGTTASNLTTLGATQQVRGVFDYWRSTTTTDPVQRIMAYYSPSGSGSAGVFAYSSNSGQTYTALNSSLENAAMPCFLVFEDLLVLALSSNNAPRAWNGTAATDSALGGSPPNFSMVVEHKGRGWAAGVLTNKSRLYYSALDNIEDWTGAGSGSIDMAADDGDEITALASHQDRLIVFKGPNRGSIQYITGSAPTGSDAFARHQLISGVGCTSHQSLIPFANDLFFADDFGVHSLASTANYGDFAERFMTREISDHWVRNLNHSRFREVVGLAVPSLGLLLWSVPGASRTQNTEVLALDMRFQPWRWARWPALSLASLALVKQSGVFEPWGGTYDGLTYRMNRTNTNINTAAYTATCTFPFLGFADPLYEFSLAGSRISYTPKGTHSSTISFTRDGNSPESVSVSQGGGSTWGTAVWGTDTWGSARYLHRFSDLSGPFREVQVSIEQGGTNDIEVHGFGLLVENNGLSLENPV